MMPFSMPFPSLQAILGPVHLLLYSTLLGAQLYQSIILTKLTFRSLPAPHFRSLQKRVFPVYFRLQSLLLVLTAVTFPPFGVMGLVKHKSDWISFAVAGVTAALNLVLYGPRTGEVMRERVRQQTRDITKDAAEADASDAEEAIVSPEMHRLNRSFMKNHAMTIHLNLVTIGAMVWYGVRLGGRLSF